MKPAQPLPYPSDRICLFGIGALLAECYPQIVAVLGREPDFLSDNDPGKWGSTFFGRPCLPPSQLSEFEPNLRIILTIRNGEPVADQLLAAGHPNLLHARFERGYNRIAALTPVTALVAAAPQPLDIRGRWALVTGASRGVGRLITLAMARLGANVIVHARTGPHLDSVLSECRAAGVEAIPKPAGLESTHAVHAFLKGLEDCPPVDILFNNAAVSIPYSGDPWHIPPEDFAQSFQVNTLAPVLICMGLIPGMIQRGFGRIIQVSSTIQHRPAEMAYACSKAAVDKFVHDLAPTLAGTGVAISLLDPGWLQTDMGGPQAPQPPLSVLPGALIGALIGEGLNGRWIHAQDYSGMDLASALAKAHRLQNNPILSEWP